MQDEQVTDGSGGRTGPRERASGQQGALCPPGLKRESSGRGEGGRLPGGRVRAGRRALGSSRVSLRRGRRGVRGGSQCWRGLRWAPLGPSPPQRADLSVPGARPPRRLRAGADPRDQLSPAGPPRGPSGKGVRGEKRKAEQQEREPCRAPRALRARSRTGPSRAVSLLLGRTRAGRRARCPWQMGTLRPPEAPGPRAPVGRGGQGVGGPKRRPLWRNWSWGWKSLRSEISCFPDT